VVTTSTAILAFKWPSALTAQLVVSIRRLADQAPFRRVALAESRHKRVWSRRAHNANRGQVHPNLGRPNWGSEPATNVTAILQVQQHRPAEQELRGLIADGDLI